MPSTGQPTIEGRSEYTDFQDSYHRWNSFVVGPFIEHIRGQYNVSRERKDTVVGGISMGGLGALRVGFESPDKFVRLAAWEPSVLPVLHWKA